MRDEATDPKRAYEIGVLITQLIKCNKKRKITKREEELLLLWKC